MTAVDDTVSWRRWLGRAAIAPRMAWRGVRWGLPARSLLFGPMSLGDDLLCTAVLHEARRRGQPFTMFTARPELFAGNHDPAGIRPIDDHFSTFLRRMKRTVISPYYVHPDAAAPDRDVLPKRHIIAEMCRLSGITGEVGLRPYLHLTDDERKNAPRLPRQIALHSTGMGAALPYPTKEWGADRFAELARLLSKDFSLVQLGSRHDPLLPEVALDLRGRTSLREAAAVQSVSLLFIGLEGFLTHLARAIDCPAVVIHGGRAPAGVFDYVANINLYSRPPCSPCGLRTECPQDLACMAAISAPAVAKAVQEMITRSPAVLPVAKVELNRDDA